MARGNKFKPVGRTLVQAEITPAAAPVKLKGKDAGVAERAEPVAGKRKRVDAGPAANGGIQQDLGPADRGQASAANTAAPASSPAAPNGQRSVKKQAQKYAGKAPLSKPGLPKASVTAVAEGGVKGGKPGRPRSKKKRQASSYAKLDKPAAPACAPAVPVVVLDSARFSTVVAPPPRGQYVSSSVVSISGLSSVYF